MGLVEMSWQNWMEADLGAELVVQFSGHRLKGAAKGLPLA